MTPRNVLLLKVFGPILIAVGALGFLTPPELALTSGAAPYNVFHLCFGVVGVVCAFSGSLTASRAFNLGFGLIDLYQALASALTLWPQQLFLWKRADDVLHVVVGLLLVAFAVALDRPRPAAA
ncbi:MAG: hypothetical protein QM817_25625 [Archangium sp.]